MENESNLKTDFTEGIAKEENSFYFEAHCQFDTETMRRYFHAAMKAGKKIVNSNKIKDYGLKDMQIIPKEFKIIC